MFACKWLESNYTHFLRNSSFFVNFAPCGNALRCRIGLPWAMNSLFRPWGRRWCTDSNTIDVEQLGDFWIKCWPLLHKIIVRLMDEAEEQ